MPEVPDTNMLTEVQMPSCLYVPSTSIRAQTRSVSLRGPWQGVKWAGQSRQ